MLGVTEKIMLGTSEDSLDHEALQAGPVAALAAQDGNARTIACGYLARGWAPLPVPRGAKAPTLPDWQKNKIKTAADVSRHFDDGPSNIGILLGTASAGLTDADLDCEEAVRLADGYLPGTASTFGRLSKPRSHRLYVASGITRETFADPESKELYLELRGNRCQTVFPGYAPPTGELVEWYENGSPPALEAAELRAATGRLAAASMLLRFSPEKGRHDYLLAVSAVLVRAWGAERAQAFLEPLAVAMLTDRPTQAAGEVRRMVDGAAERLWGDEPVGGWPKLAETLGDKRTTKLAEWLGIERPADDVSDDALALELGREWDGTAKHVALWGRWLFWTGSKWERDEKLHHLTGTRAFLREKAKKLPSTASGLRSARTVADVASLLRSNEELVGGVDQWDRDPWQLNTPAGIVDLRTGEIGPSDPLAYCTKSTAVAPAPPGTPAPLWQAFLERIFRHDLELIPYVERLLGYGLTGLTVEHVLIFAWGQGGNGKGVLFNTVARLLCDYAAIAPADLLLVTQSDRHPCDMAMLRGARLVTAQELAPGRAWDEPKLKSLTGGDPITARFIRQDFFTYEPQFLLVAAGNHKPSFKGVDEAIRRRVQLLPFLQNIPAEERDKDLPEKLRAEWPAILRRLIDGCLAWQREGLNPPESVRGASEDYLNAEDVLGQWLGERCVISVKIEFTAASALYTDWKEWCDGGNLPPGSGMAFWKRLEERGFSRKST